MKLFLVRHGEYIPENIDPEKPLSEKGKADIHKLGEQLKKEGYMVAVIYHSGKNRAQETAQILSKDILNGNRISMEEGLDPDDDVKAWAEKIQNFDEDTMIVGHLPFMKKLAGLLLSGSENNMVVEFYEGTTAVLEKTDDGKWKLIKTIEPS